MSNTGVCVMDIDNKIPVLITSVKTNPKETHGERLHTIREFMKKLIKEYPPCEIAIERGFSKMNTTTQVIYRCHGVINEVFHNYPQFYYPPATVKLEVAKHGQAKKNVVQKAILKNYPNIEFDNEDQSDAAGIAICHLIKVHKMKWN